MVSNTITAEQLSVAVSYKETADFMVLIGFGVRDLSFITCGTLEQGFQLRLFNGLSSSLFLIKH